MSNTHLFCLIYIIPTYFLYFLIIYVMFLAPKSKNKFRGSFYSIFGFSVLMFLLQSIAFYIGLRFPYISAFYDFLKNCPAKSWSYVVIYMLDYYCAAALPLYSLALSFNRFTVFIFGPKYKKFWSRFLKYILGTCFFLPFFAVWHFPLLNIQCIFIPNIGAAIYPFNIDAVSWFQIPTVLYVEILITSFLSLAMNLYVILKIIKRKSGIFENTVTVTSQDKKMFVYTLLIFFTELASCLQQFLLAHYSFEFINIITKTQYYLVDVITLAPAWFILATNKELRIAIMDIFIPKTQTRNTVQISRTSQKTAAVSHISRIL